VKKILAIFIIFVLTTMLVGCGLLPVQPEDSKPISAETPKTYYLSYYFFVNGEKKIPEAMWQALYSFGKLAIITPSTPVTEVYTEIPVPENDAKGVSPIDIVMPELDLSRYSTTQYWEERGSDLTVFGSYRMIGDRNEGMTTDELVKVYVDSAGTIQKYETVNWGKYDALGLNEERFRQLRTNLSNEIAKAVGALHYQVLPAEKAQSKYRVFTDDQNRVIITTTVVIEKDGRTAEVEFYGVVNGIKTACCKPQQAHSFIKILTFPVSLW